MSDEFATVYLYHPVHFPVHPCRVDDQEELTRCLANGFFKSKQDMQAAIELGDSAVPASSVEPAATEETAQTSTRAHEEEEDTRVEGDDPTDAMLAEEDAAVGDEKNSVPTKKTKTKNKK